MIGKEMTNDSLNKKINTVLIYILWRIPHVQLYSNLDVWTRRRLIISRIYNLGVNNFDMNRKPAGKDHEGKTRDLLNQYGHWPVKPNEDPTDQEEGEYQRQDVWILS
jgi:hypothetical protein